MNFRLKRLVLYCRQSIEQLDLDHDIVTVVGELNTGKSSTLHLIDFCLGANRPYETEALRKELLSVRLELSIGSYEVLIERERTTRWVSVTWKHPLGDPRSAVLPLQATADTHEIEDGVTTLSDMLLFLAGVNMLKVRKTPSDSESDLIRLSFRDLMFYCFVQQRYSDSNFFRLDDNARQKSRDAIRFVCGYYSARLSGLEERLETLRQRRESTELSLDQLSTVLKQVSGGEGYVELAQRERDIETELHAASSDLSEANRAYTRETHIADEMRTILRDLSTKVSDQESAVIRQEARIAELAGLRAEFYSLKFKTERSQVALAVLGDASFEYCPQCTRELDTTLGDADGSCRLCKSRSTQQATLSPEFLEATRRDLTDRLVEVESTLQRHVDSLDREQNQLKRLRSRKHALDQELSEMLQRYDSDYLERFRRAEREKARLSGELSQVQRLILIHRNISAMRSDFRELDSEMQLVRRAIEEERRTMTKAQEHVHQVERAFIENLRSVGVPGVDPDDRAFINTRTWFPRIQNHDDPGDFWDFESAGSNGRRVLFTVNYALAVHQVAQHNSLPLPSLVLLDTPTKDVSRDVNPKIHDAMDARLYELVRTKLSGTQLIVADGSFLTAPADVDAIQYRFTRDAGLIKYYSE